VGEKGKVAIGGTTSLRRQMRTVASFETQKAGGPKVGRTGHWSGAQRSCVVYLAPLEGERSFMGEKKKKGGRGERRSLVKETSLKTY